MFSGDSFRLIPLWDSRSTVPNGGHLTDDGVVCGFSESIPRLDTDFSSIYFQQVHCVINYSDYSCIFSISSSCSIFSSVGTTTFPLPRSRKIQVIGSQAEVMPNACGSTPMLQATTMILTALLSSNPVFSHDWWIQAMRLVMSLCPNDRRLSTED